MNSFSADRAKQFMPFAALKGYEEALRQKERRVQERILLGEDAQEELNYRLCQLSPGELVSVIYYCRGEYKKAAGQIVRIDRMQHIISIDGNDIPIMNIYQINEF